MKNNININFNPMPHQKMFIESSSRFKMFAGGFGSAKTSTGAYNAILLSLWYPQNIGLVGRSTYSELRDSTRRETLNFIVTVNGEEYTLINSPLVKSFNKAENHLIFTNGSEIIFRSLEDGFAKIKSLNLGWFWVDETTEISEDVWLGLEGRLRKKNVPHTGFGTTNPEGHDWVWKRFVANAENIERIPSGNPDIPEKIIAKSKDTFLISSYSNDNIYLPKDYVPNLLSRYPDEWIKRYIYGSFNTFSGLIYSEFQDKEPFVFNPNIEKIDNDWYKFVALDWGFRNPTAVLWFAVDYKGTVFVYDEYYASGKVVSEVADIIKTKSNNQKIRQYLIDPSTRNRNAINALSIIDEFADNGIFFDPANNDVRAGINRVKEFLKIQKDGLPKLRISQHCKELRRELQLYRWKDLKIGAIQDAPEKPIKKDDHASDALRYAVSFIYDTPVKSIKEETILQKLWKYAKHSSEDNGLDWRAV